jgi:hypothetical protein
MRIRVQGVPNERGRMGLKVQGGRVDSIVHEGEVDAPQREPSRVGSVLLWSG